MKDMNFICPTCKRPTHPDDNEIIEYLAKEKDRYRDILGKRTKELDRTRKALDVAVDALKIIGSGKVIEHSVMFHEDDNKIFIANKALEQITALKQKDVK